MFVNDTVRLPDSGRVCVAGFQPDAGTGRAFYTLLIDSARAEVAPMGEPRNPAYVLGVGTEIQSVKGPVFAAYFAASRDRFGAEPNYKEGLFVVIDGAVYSVGAEQVGTTIRRKLNTREFTLLRADRPQRSIEYSWPWYREPFASAKPGHARSEDFLRELSAIVATYG